MSFASPLKLRNKRKEIPFDSPDIPYSPSSSFKWGGVDSTVFEEDGSIRKHYSSFIFEGEHYRLDDSVKLTKGRTLTLSDQHVEYWPAILEQMWETASGERVISCRWYMRPPDLQGLDQSKFGEYELFDTDAVDENYAESIEGKITVLHSKAEFEKHEKEEAKKKEKPRDPIQPVLGNDGDSHWQTTGHPYIGKEVVRNFEGRLVHGRITKWVPAGDDEEEPALWHNVHNEGKADGREDEEDLEEDEVEAALALWKAVGPRRGDVYYCTNFWSGESKTLRPIHSRANRTTATMSSAGQHGTISGIDTAATANKRRRGLCQGGGGSGSRVGQKGAGQQQGDAPVDAYTAACQQLQLSAVPESMPCRTAEHGAIHELLQTAIQQGGLGCAVYISGMPGTGKTATILEVIRKLRLQHQQGKLPAFQFLEINGMKLPRPQAAYSVLWKALSGQHARPDRAAQLLDQRFNKRPGKGKTGAGLQGQCAVVVVDELDHMITKKQKVLYNLFNWPMLEHSRLVVVGIANTMDLPEVHHQCSCPRSAGVSYPRSAVSHILVAPCLISS
jgi:hypothetical protein